jgi:hypothetical protein
MSPQWANLSQHPVQSLHFFGHTTSIWLVFNTLFFFLLFQQNPKYEVHILKYLSDFDASVKPNGKSGRVSGNSTDHFQLAIQSSRLLMRTPLLNCTFVCALCRYLLRVYDVYPENSSNNTVVKWRFHRHFANSFQLTRSGNTGCNHFICIDTRSFFTEFCKREDNLFLSSEIG